MKISSENVNRGVFLAITLTYHDFQRRELLDNWNETKRKKKPFLKIETKRFYETITSARRAR